MGKSEDTVATLVNISPNICTIRYLDGSNKYVEILSLKRIKNKYKKIILPIIERTFEKTKGDILYTNGKLHCLNFIHDRLDFYVFPLQYK